jgi:hypothetical protein
MGNKIANQGSIFKTQNKEQVEFLVETWNHPLLSNYLKSYLVTQSFKGQQRAPNWWCFANLAIPDPKLLATLSRLYSRSITNSNIEQMSSLII